VSGRIAIEYFLFHVQMGGVPGLAIALRTTLGGGLLDDELSSERGLTDRRQRFGPNVVPRRPQATFWELCLDALDDPMERVLLTAGFVSLALAMINEQTRATEWIDGFAILVAGMYAELTDCLVSGKSPIYRMMFNQTCLFCLGVLPPLSCTCHLCDCHQ
jgi:hypothetical protein